MIIFIIAIITIIAGLLGALGGAEKSSKLFRRLGIPILIFISALLLKKYAEFLIFFYIPIFYLGYGIPDNTDKGSILGRFFFKLFNNTLLADIFTKLIITVLFSFILISIAIFNHKINLLYITIPITIASHVIFGAFIQNICMIKFFNRDLNVVEILRYFLLTLAALIQLFY